MIPPGRSPCTTHTSRASAAHTASGFLMGGGGRGSNRNGGIATGGGGKDREKGGRGGRGGRDGGGRGRGGGRDGGRGGRGGRGSAPPQDNEPKREAINMSVANQR